MSLTVATPVLAATSAPLTQPFVASVPLPTYDDGSSIPSQDLQAIGVFVFRNAGAGVEIWDQNAKGWRPTPGDPAILALKPLGAAPPSASGPWTVTLVAAGQKDAAGQAVYSAASGATPSYFLRGYASAKRAGAQQTGLSAPSPAFTFTDPQSNSRFGVLFDTPTTTPDAAHRARLQLKGDALQPAGYLEIRSQPGFEIEITNCDATGSPLATVVLRANGEIHLMPGSGARVIVDSDIETGRILYAPAGGGPKQWLP